LRCTVVASASTAKPSINGSGLVIGLVTFSLCLPAVWLGKRLGVVMAKRAEALGGLVLIAIGCKILIEHLRA
jgi:putative Mn2+ efflux pump MntP